MSDRRHHAACRVSYGVYGPTRDGGTCRTDIETCGCGATRSVLVIHPPARLSDGTFPLPTITPGSWNRA